MPAGLPDNISLPTLAKTGCVQSGGTAPGLIPPRGPPGPPGPAAHRTSRQTPASAATPSDLATYKPTSTDFVWISRSCTTNARFQVALYFALNQRSARERR